MKTFLRLFCADRKGATAIEYGLLAAFIAVGIIGAVTQIGQTTNGSYVAVDQAFK